MCFHIAFIYLHIIKTVVIAMNSIRIQIDDDVKEYIRKQKKNFRVCTSCSGASLVPTEWSQPKETDIKIKIGNRTLYISAVQARWLRKIDMKMIDTGSCSLFG